MSLNSRSTRRLLPAGFGLVLALLVGVSVLAVTRTEQTNRRLQAIVHEQDVKTGLMSTMFRIRRERAQILSYLFATEDPAARVSGASKNASLITAKNSAGLSAA